MSAQCFMVSGWAEAWGKPGAMFWRNHGYREDDTLQRPMPHLAVMTPAGLACLDCPETDSGSAGWTWTGEPPNVTVMPSLNINDQEWHGFLTNGVLIP